MSRSNYLKSVEKSQSKKSRKKSIDSKVGKNSQIDKKSVENFSRKSVISQQMIKNFLEKTKFLKKVEKSKSHESTEINKLSRKSKSWVGPIT